jgi:transketolase
MTDLKLGRPNLEVFADTLLALAEQDRDVIVVTSDSRGSGKLGPFGKALPDQIVEMGIAEQNLVGVAAGLAIVGKKVFAVSPACFLTARSLEQIKNDVAYSDHPFSIVSHLRGSVQAKAHRHWRLETAPRIENTSTELPCRVDCGDR